MDKTRDNKTIYITQILSDEIQSTSVSEDTVSVSVSSTENPYSEQMEPLKDYELQR